jgi:hypothetical protein
MTDYTAWASTVNDVKGVAYDFHNNGLARIAYELEQLEQTANDLENIPLHKDEVVSKAGYLRSSVFDSARAVDDAMENAAETIRALRQVLNFYL